MTTTFSRMHLDDASATALAVQRQAMGNAAGSCASRRGAWASEQNSHD